MELLNALCRLAEYASEKVLSLLKHYCRQSIFPRFPASVAGAAAGVRVRPHDLAKTLEIVFTRLPLNN